MARRMPVATVGCVILSFLAIRVTATLAQSVPPATYARGGDLTGSIDAQPPAPMVTARVENTEHTRVNLIHRTEPRNAIVHATGWEVHHVTAGRATAVTGGRVVESVDSSGARVTTIVGGEAHQVGPGDVIVIPAGTPHWYSEIDGSVTYLEVRYDPGPQSSSR